MLGPGILGEEHGHALLGPQFLFHVGVRVVDHGAGAIGLAGELAFTLDNVPNLGKIVRMGWEMSAGFEVGNAAKRLCRAFFTGVKRNLAPLPGPTDLLPLQIVGVDCARRFPVPKSTFRYVYAAAQTWPSAPKNTF